LATLPVAARAQDAGAFYRGKTLRIIVGFPPGGGFDLYARLAAEYLPRHMGVDVKFIVENMPGAATARAAAHIYGVGAQDGTVIGICHQGLLANQVLGLQNAGDFDMTRFNWIARMGTQLNVGIVWHTAGVKTIEDAKRKEVVFGATTPTATSVMVPKALNAVVGTKFRIVPGYQGSGDMALAMERGETQGFATGVWIDLVNAHADWMKTGVIFPLFQIGVTRHPDLPDVPVLGELTDAPEEKKILELLGATEDLGRAFIAGPRVPVERVAFLREAFDRMMRDEDLLREMRAKNLEINTMHGEALQALVQGVGRMSPEVVAKAKRMLVE
jgi:tripartite-type tricarboxylate transporter receptor subunit TctC